MRTIYDIAIKLLIIDSQYIRLNILDNFVWIQPWT